MKSINIRNFNLHDLPAVLALYRREMAGRKPRYSRILDADRLYRQYFQHPEYRAEGLFVAEVAGEIVGFAFGALRLYKIVSDDELPGVFVSLLLVDAAYRRRGIGTRLLEMVADFGRRHGKTLLSAHANPMNPLAFWPGVNREWADVVGFLHAHGFTAERTEVSMEQSVDAFEFSQYATQRRRELAGDGFTILPYTAEFHDALLQASGTPFWHLDLASKIERVAHPFIETAFIDLDIANIYGPADVTLALRGGELAGFVALCRNPGEAISYLGPIRIIDAFEGIGLGSVMLQTALAAERERGISLVDLWCSQENANHFYSRNGFIQRDVWDLYERQLQ